MIRDCELERENDEWYTLRPRTLEQDLAIVKLLHGNRTRCQRTGTLSDHCFSWSCTIMLLQLVTHA